MPKKLTHRLTHLVAGRLGSAATAITAVGLLFVCAYGTSLVVLRKPDGRIVMGDAVHYFVYVRSATFDRDLHFRNDYVSLYGLRGGEEGTAWVYAPTSTGHTRNMMAIGTPIAWAPLFLGMTIVLEAAAAVGVTSQVDGFGRAFQATAGFSGILAAVLGAWLTYRFAASRFSTRHALWATLVVWFSSSALYYSVISPTYSHATSMLAVGALLYYWATTLDRQTPARYAVVGLLSGLTALVRWQDAIFLIVPVVDAAWTLWHEDDANTGRLRRFAQNLGACGVTALAAFSPQLMVWLVLYGDFLVMPQGESWMQWTAPHLGKVLLSDWHGLFTWTPVTILGVVGLLPLTKREPRLGLALSAAFLASWYANGSVIEWWAGEAYGARRFVSCFPIFVLGYAMLFESFDTRRYLMATVSIALVGLNVLLLLQYQTFMHGLRDLAPYPRGPYGLVAARFVVPFDLLAWLLGR